ncbi:MAG TPA: PCI domain-containing protein [Spirochaetota bacterium]|nr:PCI domain-containing protein [Spirochaetota bacterium]
MGKIKNRVMRFFGFGLLFFGLFLLIVGIAMTVEGGKDAASGPSIAIASLAFLIPGGILIFLARQARKKHELVESIASIVKTYRRISLTTLAEKLSIPIPDAGNLLMKAVSENLIKGNFDRTTDEFYTEDSKAQRLEFKFCPNCGGPLDRVYLEGETVKCSRCGLLVG